MAPNAPKRARKAKPKAKAKRKRRSDKHAPTKALRDTVQGLAMVGTSHEIICQVILAVTSADPSPLLPVVKISPTTLRQHYRLELDWGKLRANAAVASALYNAAIQVAKDHKFTQAAIFYAKTQMGWRERERLDDVLDEALRNLDRTDLPQNEKDEIARDINEFLAELETGGRK